MFSFHSAMYFDSTEFQLFTLMMVPLWHSGALCTFSTLVSPPTTGDL